MLPWAGSAEVVCPVQEKRRGEQLIFHYEFGRAWEKVAFSAFKAILSTGLNLVPPAKRLRVPGGCMRSPLV